MKLTGLMLFFLVGLAVLEPYLPFEWVVGGLLVFSWILKPKMTYTLALILGLVLDLYWGQTLGLTSLALLFMVLTARLIHEHLAQWWVLGLIGLAFGVAGSFLFDLDSAWKSAIGSGLLTVFWWFITQATLGKQQGVYLKR